METDCCSCCCCCSFFTLLAVGAIGALLLAGVLIARPGLPRALARRASPVHARLQRG